MLVARRSLRRNNPTGSSIGRHRRLVPTDATYTPTTYTVGDDTVQFVFETSRRTGVRLARIVRGDATYTNATDALWSILLSRHARLGMRSDLWPESKRLTTVDASATSLALTWEDVPIDAAAGVIATVVWTATFVAATRHLSIGMTLTRAGTQTATQTAAVTAVCMLNLALDQGNEGDDRLQEFFACSPVNGRGETTVDPIRNLEAPHESPTGSQWPFNPAHKPTDAAWLPATADGSGHAPFHRTPFVNSHSNAAMVTHHPGGWNVPFFAYGNRAGKHGLLVTAFDPDGCHAKQLQYWSDGRRRLFVRLYEMADSPFEPNGVGGYWEQGVPRAQQPGRNTYTIGWQVRVYPFAAPTVHGDQYAAVLYRDVVVPDLEALGVVGRAWWLRAQDGEIAQCIADAPFVISETGVTATTAEQNAAALDGSKFWPDRFMTINPTADRPLAFLHGGQEIGPKHEIRLPNSSGAVAGDGFYRIPTAYGFDSAKTGVDQFALPYEFPVGAVVSEPALTYAASFLVVRSLYAAMPFFITAASSFWAPHGAYGDMLCHREDRFDREGAYTEPEWDAYVAEQEAAYHAVVDGGGNAFDSSFVVPGNTLDNIRVDVSILSGCLSCRPVRDHYEEWGRGMAAAGLTVYLDTLGSYQPNGYCMADGHTYTDEFVPVEVEHPRARSSHFYNRLIHDAVAATQQGLIDGTPENLLAAGINLGHLMSAEFAQDVLTRWIAFFIDTNRHGMSRRAVYTRVDGDAVMGTASGSSLWWQRSPFPWLESTPIWPIVYRDRSALKNHKTSHGGNVATISALFYPAKERTGAIVESPPGTWTVPVSANTTLEGARAACLNNARDLLTESHLSPWFFDTNGIPYEPQFTGAAADNETWVAMAGFAPLVSQLDAWMRFLHVEREFLLHGRLMHPLDVANVDGAYSFNLSASLEATANCYDTGRVDYATLAYELGDETPGEYHVLHAVSQHRDDAARHLLVLYNWTDAAEQFVATLDPATYGMSGTARVSTVSSDGERTEVAHLAVGETFALDVEVGAGEFLAYEFAEDDPMTLIVEDGSGLENADSFASVATADEYHAGYGNPTAWSSSTTEQKEVALRSASDYLNEQYRYRGVRANRDQAMAWPRYGAVDDDGYTIDGDVVPPQIVDATCELALALRQGVVLTPTQQGNGTLAAESFTVGGVSVSRSFSAPRSSSAPVLARIAPMLRHLLDNSAGRLSKA